jgi:formamidopyrimidine-DNA glycosylase
VQSRRHGKYLFAQTDRADWMVMHFGMTGDLSWHASMDASPRYAAVIYDFGNADCLVYSSQRRLGRVEWTDDADAYVRARDLGPDAMDEAFTGEQFIQRLSGHHGMLKSALMNQSIIAGIGNVWSDEILFQCGLWPKTRIPDMNKKTLRNVYRAMRRILGVASRRMAESKPLPDNYLTAHREDGTCPRCRTSIRKIRVSGRNSRYCPNCRQGD